MLFEVEVGVWIAVGAEFVERVETDVVGVEVLDGVLVGGDFRAAGVVAGEAAEPVRGGLPDLEAREARPRTVGLLRFPARSMAMAETISGRDCAGKLQLR